MNNEHRICHTCEVPHVENCKTCFGFGLSKFGKPISAQTAEEIGAEEIGATTANNITLLNFFVLPDWHICPECGGSVLNTSWDFFEWYIQDIWEQAQAKLNGNIQPLLCDAALVVWEDGNYDLAEKCLEGFDDFPSDYTPEQRAIVKWSLEEVAKIPMYLREYESNED